MKLSSVIHFFKASPTQRVPRHLHCLFYSHAWTVHCLDELGLLNPQTDILVELANESHLAKTLPSLSVGQHNLLGLLQPGKHLHQLSSRLPGIAAPVLLAPSQAASTTSILSALALVGTDASSLARAVILVHIRDAAAMAAAYAYMDDFSLVWDVADYPDAALPALAEVLAAEQCLDQARWQGICFCNHKQRQLPNARQRQTELQQLLDDFPVLQG